MNSVNRMEYQDFLKFLFDRESSTPGWYFAVDFIDPDISGAECVNFFKYLFDDIEAICNRHDEITFCLGINYLINNSCGDLCYNLLNENIPESDRLSSISSMFNIFEKVFQEKCTVVNKEQYEPSVLPTYQWLCYMWWDIFPRHGIPAKTELKLTDRTILETIEKILLLDNPACKESALHGLGHWHSAYPEIVENILFVNRNEIPDFLIDLADRAGRGRLM